MTNFFMVPNEVFDLNLKPQQFAVLCYILKCCDESNTCYPSIHTIAEACAISDNTVRESIKFLCKRKIITKSGGFTVDQPEFLWRRFRQGQPCRILQKRKLCHLIICNNTLCEYHFIPHVKYCTPLLQILHPWGSEFTPPPFRIWTRPLQNLKPNNTHRKRLREKYPRNNTKWITAMSGIESEYWRITSL